MLLDDLKRIPLPNDAKLGPLNPSRFSKQSGERKFRNEWGTMRRSWCERPTNEEDASGMWATSRRTTKEPTNERANLRRTNEWTSETSKAPELRVSRQGWETKRRRREASSWGWEHERREERCEVLGVMWGAREMWGRGVTCANNPRS